MDRRLLGVMLVITGAIGAIIAGNLSGHRIVGIPIAAEVPPAPVVGACVIAITALPPTDPDVADDAAVDYPSARYGHCPGPMLGEVMSVDTQPHPLDHATIESYQHDSSICGLAEVNYVGSIGPFDPATITTPGIAWEAQVQVEYMSIGPDRLQRAAGQSWVACVVVAADGSSYTGTLAGALTDGTLPPEFATCWPSLELRTAPRPLTQELIERAVPCASPHLVEIIALTDLTELTGAGTSEAGVQRSCAGMASRALRAADPTRGGQLSIRAYSFDGDSMTPVAAVSPAGTSLACVASVATPYRLTGTLVGIGAKPLPVSR